MAVVFEITDGTTAVSFDDTTGPEMEASFLPVYATPPGDGTIPPDITEAIPAYIHITSGNNFAGTLQDVYRLAEQAAFYASGKHQTPVWLSRKLNDETGEIRTLVDSIIYTPNARFGGPFDTVPCLTDGRTGVFTITHHAYWERDSAVAASGSNGVSVLGGAVNYTDVVGDVDARMYYLHVDDMANATTVYQIWAGFRSDWRASGDAALVQSLWEIEDGTPGTDAGVTTDATASPGGAGNTKVQVSFATDTWAERATIVVSDVTANEGSQTGAFVVLLRAKVNQGEAQVKLRQYSVNADVYREGPVVDIAATAWNLYNLGVIEFPMRDLHAIPIALFADSYDQTDRLKIWGRVKPGSAAVPNQTDLDCLILIPCDEYFVHVRTAAALMGSDDDVWVCISPEDTSSAVVVDSAASTFEGHIPADAMGAGIPNGDGRMFICTANDDSGAAPGITATVNVELSTYPRWIALRGAE